MSQFNLYPWVYVNRKSRLFPLIEKYSGQSMKGKTHGQAIALYLDLLKSSPEFSAEVDSIITGSNKNAGGLFATIGGVINSITAGKERDAEFAQAVLEQQKAKNTQTLFIVGGLTIASLALVGFFIYMAAKKKGK